MNLFVVVAIAFCIGLFIWWVMKADKCPSCKTILDEDYHGYNQLYRHCHNCDYCTCCGVKS